MDFLLFLVNYGCEVDPMSQAGQFDFDGNGVLDMSDLLVMLNNQPPIEKSWQFPKSSR